MQQDDASTSAESSTSTVRDAALRAKMAAREVATLSADEKNQVLLGVAECVEAAVPVLMMFNAQDVSRAEKAGLAAAKIARLKITPESITQCVAGLRQIAAMTDPVGQVTEERTVPSGLKVQRVRAPLGVIAMIYEARPLVTLDAFALCFKAGNACVLKGGREASETNTAVGKFIHAVLEGLGHNPDACVLLPTLEREQTRELLGMADCIDLAIPRGGPELIAFVREHAKMPTVQHAQGVCHIYVDEDADLEMALKVCVTAKTSAPATCNAAECVLVHASVATALVPRLCEAFREAGVQVRADAKALALTSHAEPAGDDDFGREFLALVVALKVVSGMDEAIAHIHRYGSDHTEAILTRNPAAADWFVNHVQSSCVVVNASTRFNDGFQLGLGAEIGISTSRVHAYGPMGLEELTTRRWVVRGDGQTR